jgi:hypothetical protein
VIDATVGADVTVTSFGDQHSLGSKDSHALVEDHLHESRVGCSDQMWGQSNGFVARGYLGEISRAALSLGDDFLRNDNNISGHQVGPRADQIRQVITKLDLRQAFNGYELEAPQPVRRA